MFRCFKFQKTLNTLCVTAWLVMVVISCSSGKQINNNTQPKWIGTWATAPQLVEPHNMPPQPGLTNNSIRQVVRVSIGGSTVRLRFSNIFSKAPVTFKSVSIAVAKEGSVIDPGTLKFLKFKGQQSVTVEPGAEVFSDALDFVFSPGSKLSITIYFGQTSPDVTGHPGSRTTSYILEGDHAASVDFANAVKTDHWYLISGVDVLSSPKAFAIAALGNSITDGRGSGTNKQNRWPDILSERLLNNEATKNVGVLNLGIGGNCVLRGGLGPTALARFERDILGQSGVKWLVILEGINDIGGIKNADAGSRLVTELIEAYSIMADKAHAKGIKVYGCTILPFEKSFYDTPHRQEVRTKVNEWIRTTSKFDAVIDFDKTMRQPDDVNKIRADMHDNDWLHPNQKGYKEMAMSIDLNLFK